ncbi:acetyl-CoA-benzylalcohol acetyltransferase-like [Syzygium oleosum]|uniref:acetyl-CoA-benzylalcohol acetyltransferase-like n=1 Tax=Syzygium oleosum TaxID=219896 RepID=UPI0024B8F2F1|nr:acetyl-CoA-benzylalcohol acetyltransferase-like [Syzygium oleosum]XP_056159353.1 acetyl-CoA-benzylalcohol acetyltransferase-like [Syzygium oleosum]
MKIEVQSKKLIKPSAPTPNHRRKLNISCIDELVQPLYAGFLFYYQADGENHEEDIFQRLRLLEESLSETLAIFYPLAGRYVEEGLFIDCNDQGVEFVHAKVNGQLDQLLQGEFDTDLLGRLSKFRMGPASNPLVMIQANVFECGGLVISLRSYHKLGDMCTMATFMNSWATACRSGVHEVASPYFELSSLFPVKGSGVTLMPPLLAGVKLTINRFLFSGAALSRLKLAGPKNVRISRVEVVSALLCKALVTLDRAKHGRLRPLVICQNMNLRGRVNLPIPTNAFGNFVTKVNARHTMHQSSLDFEAFVKMIHDMFASAKTRFAAIADRESCMDMVKEFAREYKERVNSDEDNVVDFTSWCGFPFYDIDFGWGKPDLVSNAGNPVRKIVLIDSKSEGGIDAWIIVGQEEKVLLEQDPDIVAFTS